MNQNHKRRLSRTAVLVISGVIVWPLWFGLLACVGIFTEEVLGWKDAYHGPEWIPKMAVIGIFGMGLFLWKALAAMIESRWGEPASESEQSSGEVERNRTSRTEKAVVKKNRGDCQER